MVSAFGVTKQVPDSRECSKTGKGQGGSTRQKSAPARVDEAAVALRDARAVHRVGRPTAGVLGGLLLVCSGVGGRGACTSSKRRASHDSRPPP